VAEPDPLEALNATPFARSLRAGTPSLIGYVGFLRLVAAFQAALVRVLQRDLDETVAACLEETVAGPHALLLEDCDHFRGEVDDVLPAMAVASEGTQRVMRTGTATAPLLGHAQALVALHRLEASADAIAESLALGDGGVAFLRAAPRATSAAMAAAVAAIDGRDLETVSEARRGLSTIFARALAALEPVEAVDLGIHVLAVNPEGGSHPVTQDRREVHAALAATDHCLERLPYIVERYGARGRRFTDSDGLYLAHLVGADPEFRQKRLDWLGRLLSARGMPTGVLRLHLEIMADELDRATPDDAERFAVLRNEAARLRAALDQRIAPEDRERLVTRYAERAAGDPADERALEHGRLMVDAVCNEADGHRKAVESLVLWLVAPQRADRRSIEAVAALLDEARALAG
jgi:hypothetical protein